ncbi:MAG: geranylgeranyl reductase family protein [Halobacteriales archaeon]|nr:geranylgeranyl reductase family protein [Halobacteriales archaeon]
MKTEEADLVVVGGGTGGCFAAASAASEGLDVVLLERKSREDGGHIACGDAIKGAGSLPNVIDRDYVADESFTNQEVRRGIFEADDETIEIPLPVTGKVMDRKRYGEVILEEAERAGAEVVYDTVAQGVVQNGKVEGVRAIRKGERVEYRAPVTVDAAGALSVLQDDADLSGATFDTNVKFTQFCSAYREIIEVDEPVEWSDALVFKPAEQLGYIWYFPRTPTEINVGLGFQMTEEPMKLVDALRRDVQNRDEFVNARVVDKLGAALPTRRPYDSAVAPGFVAVGDAAGHVNPTTGGGIPGAAKSGAWAGEIAADAVVEEDVSEDALWEYNERVMHGFGKKFAATDLYNIFGTAHGVEELTGLVKPLPGQQLVDALGEGNVSMSLGLKIKTLVKTFGYWGLLRELYGVHKKTEEIKETYASYPSIDGFDAWKEERDALMDEVYEITGASPKY